MTGKIQNRSEFETFLTALHRTILHDEPKLVALENAKILRAWKMRPKMQWFSDYPRESYVYVCAYIENMLNKVRYNTEVCELTLDKTDLWYIAEAVQISGRLQDMEMSGESDN